MPLPKIYLASDSKQRQELLSQIGVEFSVVGHGIDETPLPGESGAQMVERLAIAKAKDALARLQNQEQRPVLGADTAVVIGEEILGKPLDESDGLRMMALMSGRTHFVYTAVAVVDEHQLAVRVNKSQVSFAQTSTEFRLQYWQSGESADKAGAYAIQGMAGIFIKHIEGSYSGIMGLPLYETYELLKLFR